MMAIKCNSRPIICGLLCLFISFSSMGADKYLCKIEETGTYTAGDDKQVLTFAVEGTFSIEPLDVSGEYLMKLSGITVRSEGDEQLSHISKVDLTALSIKFSVNDKDAGIQVYDANTLLVQGKSYSDIVSHADAEGVRVHSAVDVCSYLLRVFPVFAQPVISDNEYRSAFSATVSQKSELNSDNFWVTFIVKDGQGMGSDKPQSIELISEESTEPKDKADSDFYYSWNCAVKIEPNHHIPSHVEGRKMVFMRREQTECVGITTVLIQREGNNQGRQAGK